MEINQQLVNCWNLQATISNFNCKTNIYLVPREQKLHETKVSIKCTVGNVGKDFMSLNVTEKIKFA